MPDMLSNTSCLIALDNIGQLELLCRVYGIIHISEEVAAEFGVFVPAWIKVHSVQDKTKLDILHNLVDLGEASTITLAYQFMEQLSLLEFSDISQPTKGKELVFESVSKGFQLQSAD